MLPDSCNDGPKLKRPGGVSAFQGGVLITSPNCSKKTPGNSDRGAAEAEHVARRNATGASACQPGEASLCGRADTCQPLFS